MVLRGCLDVGFPSIPGLFRETKLCSILSPAPQPQQIPVTCSRHTLKKNCPATETSVSPHIYQHTNYFCHLHTYTPLCSCPISTLSSEILIFHYHFSFRLLVLTAEWNPSKQNRTHIPYAANVLQNEATSWLHLKPSPRSHSTNQHKLTRAGPGFRTLNSPNLTDSKKSGTSPQLSTFASSLHQSSFLPSARYCHKSLEKHLLN